MLTPTLTSNFSTYGMYVTPIVVPELDPGVRIVLFLIIIACAATPIYLGIRSRRQKK